MKKLNKRLVIITVALVAVIGGIIIIGGQNSGTDEPTQVPADIEPQASVRITADGFEPATLSVEAGTTVEWINEDDSPHRVASNPHPEHTDLGGLDSMEPISPGGTYRFTFEEAGEFGYHDHLNPTENGTIVVTGNALVE
jgi:plastocyanin